jgi:hypothetical protein
MGITRIPMRNMSFTNQTNNSKGPRKTRALPWSLQVAELEMCSIGIYDSNI